MGNSGSLLTCWMIAANTFAFAQSNDTIAVQLRDFAEQISQLRRELADSRQESLQLRREINEIRRQITVGANLPPPADQPAGAAFDSQPPTSAAVTLEDHQLLAAKVDDHYQTKVESASKYRVKLSGMALLTASSVHGSVSSLDLPDQAVARGPGESNGALGASMRQSILGVDVFGPTIAGARTRGTLRADFFGGLPETSEGATSGFARLRTGTLTLDWQNHSLEAGVDTPFFSPRSPDSLVSTAYPALWSAGNLWTWTPQIHATHRRELAENSRLTVQYGLLDALTGQLPGSEYERLPTAGERHRTPAVASRVAIEHGAVENAASIGAGVYFARQNWGYARRVSSWTATADWILPIGSRFSISGELYRGSAMAGLGGGLGGSVLLDGALADRSSRVLPVDRAGGWAQARFKASSRWTLNAAFGGDYPFRILANLVPAGENEAGFAAKRNSSGFVNTIYQPRSNLLFSVEYRRLWTTPFGRPKLGASHVGVGAAVLF